MPTALTIAPAPAPDTRISLHDRAGLDTADAAIYVGLSVPTLKKYRLDGTGPRFAKIGTKVIYRPRDLEAWLDKHMVGKARR